jgi:fructose-1,6-bisphosphatase/inositol monophosphatase family enzyme
MFDERTLPRHRRLADSCQFRIWGGDCYSYGLLAAGFTDLVCEADLFPYDYLALVPVVEGAGGIITDWDGNPLTLGSGDRVVAASNRALHDAALAMLAV